MGYGLAPRITARMPMALAPAPHSVLGGIWIVKSGSSLLRDVMLS